jgi:hypothetical protein
MDFPHSDKRPSDLAHSLWPLIAHNSSAANSPRFQRQRAGNNFRTEIERVGLAAAISKKT